MSVITGITRKVKKTPAGGLLPLSVVMIDEALSMLNYRERNIIRLRYGLDDGVGFTLEECGKVYKINRERVRQIQARAERKLRDYFK